MVNKLSLSLSLSLSDCVCTVCAVDMDDTLSDELKLSTSLKTELQDSTYDDSVRPPYEHVDHVTAAAAPPRTEDRAAADQPPSAAGVQRPLAAAAPPRQRLQRPRSTTKCPTTHLEITETRTASCVRFSC